MTIFIIAFFLYIVMRLVFRQRQSQIQPILLIGTRFAVAPEHVRMVSIIGMVAIALIIVLVMIMGYPMTPDHIAYLLTIGVIVMSIQYYPLLLIGEKGFASLDTRVFWDDIVGARVAQTVSASLVKLVVDFKGVDKNKTFYVYLQPSQLDDFKSLMKERTSIILS